MSSRISIRVILLTSALLLLLLSQLPQLITALWPLSNHGQIKTRLYLPATASQSNPAPLLVYFGGSEGGMSMAKSQREKERQQYLDAGFALLVIGYFGLPDTPADLDRIELTSIAKTIKNTLSTTAIDSNKLAVMGVSKGAELALTLASRVEAISTVISVVGSDTVFGSPEWYSTSSSWTWQGKALPFVPFPFKSAMALMQGQYRQGHELAMQNNTLYQQAKIPVERMQADVLFISGTADEVWPSSEMSDRMMSRLKQHHYKFDSQHIKSVGAGHAGLSAKYQQEIIKFLVQSQQVEVKSSQANSSDCC